jgi:hypothetical protein
MEFSRHLSHFTGPAAMPGLQDRHRPMDMYIYHLFPASSSRSRPLLGHKRSVCGFLFLANSRMV